MSHFWNDSLLNLSEPNLDIFALSHSSISNYNIKFEDFPMGTTGWTIDALEDPHACPHDALQLDAIYTD